MEAWLICYDYLLMFSLLFLTTVLKVLQLVFSTVGAIGITIEERQLSKHY